MKHTSNFVISKRAALALVVASCLGALAAAGCGRGPEFLGDAVVGFYRGDYGNAAESIELRRDYTFVQELKIDGATVYRNEGSWRVAGTDIAFDNFFRAVEPGSGKVVLPEAKTSNVRGFWLSWNHGRFEIVFEPRGAYRFKKMGEPVPVASGAMTGTGGVRG